MRIDNSLLLHDIQVGFNQLFPHLKLGFYTTAHQIGEGTPKRLELNTNQKLGEVCSPHKDGSEDLAIHADMTVAELELRFEEQYGLHAQVFRKSGNIWIQTTATDSWTLGEQNRKGGSSELHFSELHST